MGKKKKAGRDLPEGIYPNKYRKRCAHPDCEIVVEPNEGFIERVEDGGVTWRTWCQDHVPNESHPPADRGRDRRSDEYYDNMLVVTQRGTPVAEAEIQRCAKELGIRHFPCGYPELMSRFGPGEFNDFLRMLSPAQVVEWRTQNPGFRALDIGHSVDGDRFSFKPTRPDWIFVIPRHHSGVFGAGWGVPKMLDWLASDTELNESGAIREIYYRPDSDETCMIRLRQIREAPSGERLEKALAGVIEPTHVTRNFREKYDGLEVFYSTYGGHIEYATWSDHTQMYLWLDCEHAAEFLKVVWPVLKNQGFEEVITTSKLPANAGNVISQ